jgi:hypothetical protein
LRGKAWSIGEERLLRQLVEEGRGIDGISQVMGKSRTAIKGRLNNLGLGLNLIVVATGLQNSVATTTTSLVPIADSVEVIGPASVANSDLVEEVEADLKIKRPLTRAVLIKSAKAKWQAC